MCNLTIEKMNMVRRAGLLKARLGEGNGEVAPGEKMKMLGEIAQLMKEAGLKKKQASAELVLSQLCGEKPMGNTVPIAEGRMAGGG